MLTRPARPRRRPARPLLLALVAAAALATGLALWGGLHQPASPTPFVAIRGFGCGGVARASGFAVADDLVATAAHPLAGRNRVAVTDSSGATHHGFVVALDPALDVAAVRVPGLAATPVALATGDDPWLAPSGSTGVVASVPDSGEPAPKPYVVSRRVRVNIEDIYLRNRVSRRSLELHFAAADGDSGAAVLTTHDPAAAVPAITDPAAADLATAALATADLATAARGTANLAPADPATATVDAPATANLATTAAPATAGRATADLNAATVVGMVFATSRSRADTAYAVRAIEIAAVLAQVADLPRRTPCP